MASQVLRAEPRSTRLPAYGTGTPPEWRPVREPAESELSATVRKLWRRKWLMAGVALTVIGIAVLVVSQLKPRYSAAAEVSIGAPEVRTLNVEEVVRGLRPDNAVVQSEVRVILSRALAERVVDRLGLEREPEFNPALRPESWNQVVSRYLNPMNLIPESWRFWKSGTGEVATSAETQEERERRWTVNSVMDATDAALVGRSYILQVEVRSEKPEMAARIANTLADAYLEEQINRKVELTRQASGWLQNEIGKLSAEVEKADSAVEAYRSRKGLYQARQVSVTEQQLSELNSQLVSAQAARAEADSRISAARQILNNPDATPEVMISPVVQGLKQRLAEARGQLADMASRFGPEHPRRIQLQAQVNELSQQVRTETQNVLSSLQSSGRAAEARAQSLQRTLDGLKVRMGVTNEDAVQLASLERQAHAKRQMLESLMTRSQEAVAQLGVQGADARVVSRAVISEVPTDPPKQLLLVVSALVGILLGAIAALIREGVDKSFRSATELESATGLPNLGTLPALWRRREMNPDVAVGNLASTYCNALRQLFTSATFIERIGPDGDRILEMPRVLVITSAVPAEGKTALSSHLAALLAKCGKRVALVDADARKRRFRWLAKGAEPGLGELLRGEVALADMLKSTGNPNLHVIRPGRLPDEEYDLLSSDRMEGLLRDLQETHDVVIVDTPPVLVGAEVVAISRIVDAVLFVVRWGHTSQERVLDALKQLQLANAPLVGTALTRIRAKEYRRYSYGYSTYGPRRAPRMIRAS
jgi:capsular exopolysaccharide synthesis family protein